MSSMWSWKLSWWLWFQAKVAVAEEAIAVDDIPIETLTLDVELETSKGLDGLAKADKYYQEALAAEKKKKRSKKWVNRYFIISLV